MELYPHQVAAVEWLVQRRRAGLFDEQGLGKTACAICAADQIITSTLDPLAQSAGLAQKQRTPILVVAPTVVVHNWAREFLLWAPHLAVQVITNGRDRVATPAVAQVVVVTHSLLRTKAIHDQLLTKQWAVCIVDEAHAFKNHRAQRTRALYGYRAHDGQGVVSRCDYVWLLTGTPMPNNPTELWTHLAALAPERIQKPFNPAVELEPRPLLWGEFRKRYCKLAPSNYGDGWKVVGAQNTTELSAKLKGFALRRLKKNVLDLPPIRWGTTVVTGELTAELIRAERKLEHQKLEDIRETEHFSTWRRLCGIAKAPAAADMLIDELSNNPDKKVVVFAHHTEVIDYLRAALDEPFGTVEITGSTPAHTRQTNVALFQDDSQASRRYRVALCNIVAGGLGVTLTAANDVVFVEQSFVPGENAQAADRCHRIGQTGSVLVRCLSLAGSIDELIVEILQRKSQMIREVIK